MASEPPFNPLDKQHLGESVADALLSRPVGQLPPSEPFIGAGIYAIYYAGGYPAYAPIAERNRDDKFETPIYIGKAVPAGARKGGFGLGLSPGTVLFKRLEKHAESIRQATNLDLVDFACRFLVVEDIWIPLAESLLIEMFSPAWNKLIDGFGNNDPGQGRHGQRRPSWDVLHPGRPWADRLTGGDARPVHELLATLAVFLSSGPDAVTTTSTTDFIVSEEQPADEEESGP